MSVVNVINILISCICVFHFKCRIIYATLLVAVGVCLVFHACMCVCQVIVHEVPGQELEVEVFDKDPDHDDFLGRYHITAFPLCPSISHLFFKEVVSNVFNIFVSTEVHL